MTWEHKVLVYRLLNPVHIGYRKTGNLMQTRPYVHWRVWGSAFTVALVRGLSKQEYRGVGKILEDMFRFGYGWPAVLKEGRHNVSSLGDLEMGFDLWKEDREAFEYRFLNARAGTALEPDGTAREGSLHHVEYIAPFARDTGQPVFLILDLWIRETDQKSREVQEVRETWEEHTRVLQIGGERGYGWGRVEQVFVKEWGSGKTVVGDLTWEKQNGEICIQLSKKEEAVLPFHVKAEGGISVAGPVEVLAGYRYYEGRRRLIESPPVAFAPGSKVLQELWVVPDPACGFRAGSCVKPGLKVRG